MRRQRHSGIYQIKIGDRIYIGKSNDVFMRWSKHLTDLFADKHHNSDLQVLFNQTNYRDIEFRILKLCRKTELNKLEKEFITSADQEKLLNKKLKKVLKVKELSV